MLIAVYCPTDPLVPDTDFSPWRSAAMCRSDGGGMGAGRSREARHGHGLRRWPGLRGRLGVRLIAEVLGQLDLERPLDQPLGQLGQQPAGADDLLPGAGAGQQLVDPPLRPPGPPLSPRVLAPATSSSIPSPASRPPPGNSPIAERTRAPSTASSTSSGAG